MTTFMIKVPVNADHDAMDALNETMTAVQDEWSRQIDCLAKELGITYTLASQIWYLRTRSRHSTLTEERMIQCYKETGTEEFNTLAGEEEESLSKLGY